MFGDTPPPSGTALKTLLLVIGITIAAFVFAYGWEVTDINLEEPQDQTRQDQVTRALRELLSPNIFDQKRESEIALVNFQKGCTEDGEAIEQPEVGADTPYLVITPDCGESDEMVTVKGYNFDFYARNIGIVRWVRNDQRQTLSGPDGLTLFFSVDRNGEFEVNFEVPRGRGSAGEINQVEAEVFHPVGAPYFSETSHTVFERMVETIFLALMATVIALPIAVMLSFIAARNLMRQVNLPFGSVLVGFILFPIGWIIGTRILAPFGNWASDISDNFIVGVVALGVVIAAFTFVMRFLGRLELPPIPKIIVNNSVLLITFMLILGLLGGLGNELGEQILKVEEDLEISIFSNLAQMVADLGELISLLITLFGGLLGGFWVSSVGSTLLVPVLKPIRGMSSRILAGILGLISGAILLALFGLLSLQAALLGVIAPIIAAAMGYQVAQGIFQRVTAVEDNKTQLDIQAVVRLLVLPRRAYQLGNTLIGLLGAAATFAFAFMFLNAGRSLFDGQLPLEQTTTLAGQTIELYIVKTAVLGGVLGGIIGFLTGLHQEYPLGMTVYNITRTVLNATRSIEPLIMGIVFVIWVGIGPFAGMLALTLHSIASLGKLYSEQVENIDPGPIEAIQATGANRLQTVIYAVIPQIVPPYIAFTMYRWDINVRMSTIIGFVGGGGIGFILQQQINLLRYQDAGVAVLAIAIVVSVLDYVSAAIREAII